MTTDKIENLNLFFEPGSIALFGSMREPGGEAFNVIRNMLAFGFKGKIFPISRSSAQVLGIRAYPTVGEVNDVIDLAMIITPPATVLPLIEQCGQKGIKAVIISTEGFAEASTEGREIQRKLVETAHRYGMRLIGPNTLGVLNTSNGLATALHFIGQNKPRGGGVSYCTQTGFLAFGVHPLKDLGYPISKVCDFGNKCDVNELDLLSYLADDPSTNVICMHLEDVKDGKRFKDVALKAAARKPVLLLKPGRSEAGAKAVSSHTGSLAGDDQIYDSAFKQAGVIRLRTWREYWDVPKALSMQPIPKGSRIAVVTATGGAGVLLIDAAAEYRLIPAVFTAATQRQLGELSPRLGNNPVDVGPLMSVREAPFSVYEDIVPLVLSDPNVDCLAVVCHFGPPIVKILTGLAPLISSIGKPVTVFGYGYDLTEMLESARRIEDQGLPAYLDLESAAKALGVAAQYSRIKARLRPDFA